MMEGTDRDHLGRQLRSFERCALFKRRVRLSCRQCRHIRVLDAVCLWWLFHRRGWPDDLPEAMARFYCSACWVERSVRVHCPRFAIVEDAPTGDPLPYPDRGEWRRLVSRFRS